MNTETLKNIFKAPYQSTIWKAFLKEIFRDIPNNFFENPIDLKDENLVKHKDVEHIWEFGDIELADNKVIKFYEVVLKENQQVTKNRVGLRSIIHTDIVPGYIDGILVTYHNHKASDWRFTFVSKSLYWDEDNNEVKTETNPKRYTYLLGKNETIKTAVKQFEWVFKQLQNHKIKLEHILRAFSVEKISKEFYDGYFHQYETFVGYIVDNPKAFSHFLGKVTQSESEKDKHEKAEHLASDFVKKFLGRMVFLYFLQKKGWMGVPSGEKWGNGQRDFLSRMFDEFPDKNNFYEKCLVPLFFHTLNEDRSSNDDLFSVTNSRIPYLNGGLFEKDAVEPTTIQFESQKFIDLFAFFNNYNFTVDENSPDDQDIGVDPEMLGHIFENLLEDNKDKGAFYTPKEIVHYMTQESLIEYLHTHLPITNKVVLTEFVKQKRKGALSDNELDDINNLLNKVKICDPAIGSGAFPMGLLHEIFALKGLIAFEQGFAAWSPARVKERIIENSIYGVDIEDGAVDIARLRFWLSLVVDEPEPRPLPNLDYKIICGNSLISRYELDVPIKHVFTELNKGREEKIDLAKYKELERLYMHESDHDKKDKFKKLIEEIKSAFKTSFENRDILKVAQARGDVDNLQRVDIFGNIVGTKKQIADAKKKLKTLEDKRKEILEGKIFENAVEWRFEFPHLLDDNGNFEGFDIVIGNPPWGAKIEKLTLVEIKRKNEDIISRMTDSFMFFVNKSIQISKKQGVITKIIPEVILNQQDNALLRKKIMNLCQINNIVNLGDGVFNGVTRASCILQLSKDSKPVFQYIAGDFKKVNGKIQFLNTYSTITSDIIANLPYNIFPSKDIDLYKIYNKIKHTEILSSFLDEDGIQRGVSPDYKEAFIVSSDIISRKNLEVGYLRKTVTGGKDVKKYSYNTNNKHIVYTSRDTDISKIPNILGHILEYRDKITCNEVKEGKHPIFALHRPRVEKIFTKKSKLMGVITGDKLILAHDSEQIYPTDGIFVLSTSNIKKDKALMALLNSKLATVIYRLFSNEEGKTLAQVKPNVLDNIPIPINLFDYTNVLSTLSDYIQILKINLNEKGINDYVPNSHIAETFEEVIDAIVYELYFFEDFEKVGIHFIKYAERDFLPIEGKTPDEKKEIIHNAYQKLRDKDNEIRNNLKEMKIELRNLIMPILTI